MTTAKEATPLKDSISGEKELVFGRGIIFSTAPSVVTIMRIKPYDWVTNLRENPFVLQKITSTSLRQAT